MSTLLYLVLPFSIFKPYGWEALSSQFFSRTDVKARYSNNKLFSLWFFFFTLAAGHPSPLVDLLHQLQIVLITIHQVGCSRLLVASIPYAPITCYRFFPCHHGLINFVIGEL